jgi:hypothetical protein
MPFLEALLHLPSGPHPLLFSRQVCWRREVIFYVGGCDPAVLLCTSPQQHAHFTYHSYSHAKRLYAPLLLPIRLPLVLGVPTFCLLLPAYHVHSATLHCPKDAAFITLSAVQVAVGLQDRTTFSILPFSAFAGKRVRRASVLLTQDGAYTHLPLYLYAYAFPFA